MKDWSVDKIIAVGLTASCLVTVLAMDVVAVLNGDMTIGGMAKELAIGLFGYMSRGVSISADKDITKKREGN